MTDYYTLNFAPSEMIFERLLIDLLVNIGKITNGLTITPDCALVLQSEFTNIKNITGFK